ncbi:MAG: hypothetical protein IJX98_03440 [Clostridia bacterium]|nr:hypothetical protein [Clostridia bacterium]
MAIFIVAGAAALLFAPIFLHTNLFYDMTAKKTGVCLLLYGKIKLIGGYITTCAGGVAVHISDQKALIFSYRDLDTGRKKYSPQNGFSLHKIAVSIFSSAEYFLPVLALQRAVCTATALFAKNKKIVKSRVFLCGGETFKAYAKIVIKLTVFSQIVALIKYLIRSIQSLWQKTMKKSVA